MSLEHRHAILDALMAVLDEEHARAVLEHRKVTLKRPLTEYAAKLLAKRFAEWGNANEAAEIMIERCWQGFQASWVRDRPRPGSAAFYLQQHNRRTVSDVFGEIASGTWTPQNDDSLTSRH